MGSYQKIKNFSHVFNVEAVLKKKFSDKLVDFQKIEICEQAWGWYLLSEQQEWWFLYGVLAAEQLTHQLDSKNSSIKTHPRDLNRHVTDVTSERKTREVTPTTWLKIKTWDTRGRCSSKTYNARFRQWQVQYRLPRRSLLLTFEPYVCQ